MKIDWFTAAAQIINLFILVWLLRRFLYHPILNAMNQRRQKIAHSFNKAERIQREAEEEKIRYQALQDEVEQQARQKLQEARRKAGTLRERLMAQASSEADEARRKWLKELDREKKLFLIRTSRTIAEEFGRLERAAFRDLANRDFEEDMVEIFLEKTGKKPDREILASLRENENKNILVSSSLELKNPLCLKIREHLQEVCGEDITVDFAIDPDLLAGIIVEVEGKKVGWHLSRYLDDFQERLEAGLERLMQQT